VLGCEGEGLLGRVGLIVLLSVTLGCAGKAGYEQKSQIATSEKGDLLHTEQVSLEKLGGNAKSLSSQFKQFIQQKNRYAEPVSARLPRGEVVIPLSLSEPANAELAQMAMNELLMGSGYQVASSDLVRMFGLEAPEVTGLISLVRLKQGHLDIIQMGQYKYKSGVSKFWVDGYTYSATKKLVAENFDLIDLKSRLGELAEKTHLAGQSIAIKDLKAKNIDLSFTDASSALQVLKSLGYTVRMAQGSSKKSSLGGSSSYGANYGSSYGASYGANYGANYGASSINSSSGEAKKKSPGYVDFKELPLIIELPKVDEKDVALVGQDRGLGRGGISGKSKLPSSATHFSSNVDAAPVDRILVLFHPDHPEQFSQVKEALRSSIDVQARQVLVEAMVLEVNKSDLHELGVNWTRTRGQATVSLGANGFQGNNGQTLLVAIDRATRGTPLQLLTNIRALVQDGKAEIMSRPSIVVLNNRQAAIRVGEDVPIATQTFSTGQYSNGSVRFEYIPTGILLNVRPKISADNKEVTLMVDAVVSSEVLGGNVTIKDATGAVTASAPKISMRRVQTFATVKNQSPLIIGGLISKDAINNHDSLPLLGKIPLLGRLFGAEKIQDSKKEVIIVLTPYVLEKDVITRATPQDSDMFDSKGNQLFRDLYRVRSSDAFDIDFLKNNKRVALYSDRVREAVIRDFRLADQEPYRSFTKYGFPGESILVTKILHGISQRLGLDALVDEKKIIFFEEKKDDSFYVQTLSSLLERLGGGKSLIRQKSDQALAITFYRDREELGEGYLLTEPKPELKLVTIRDRAEWAKKLWDMNQPTADGKDRKTIILHRVEDLIRLKHAIMIKQFLELNGGEDSAYVDHYGVGRMLLLPSAEGGDDFRLIDFEVAAHFFYTEHYYSALNNRIEEAIKEVDRALGMVSMVDASAVKELIKTKAGQGEEGDPDGVSTDSWVINLASFHSAERAQRLYEKIQAMGLPVESFVKTINGQQWIRVSALDFHSRSEAEKRMSELARIFQLGSSWVELRKQ